MTVPRLLLRKKSDTFCLRCASFFVRSFQHVTLRSNFNFGRRNRTPSAYHEYAYTMYVHILGIFMYTYIPCGLWNVILCSGVLFVELEINFQSPEVFGVFFQPPGWLAKVYEQPRLDSFVSPSPIDAGCHASQEVRCAFVHWPLPYFHRWCLGIRASFSRCSGLQPLYVRDTSLWGARSGCTCGTLDERCWWSDNMPNRDVCVCHCEVQASHSTAEQGGNFVDWQWRSTFCNPEGNLWLLQFKGNVPC